MRKTILFFALVVSFAMLIPSVSAKTQTTNYNDKWAFAMGLLENGCYFMISADADNAFIAICCGQGGWQLLDHEFVNFKWSMDHVTLMIVYDGIEYTIEWDTCGPTKTKHYNEKFDFCCWEFHFVSNCKYRPALVTATNSDGEEFGCGWGHVNHGTGSTIVSF